MADDDDFTPWTADGAARVRAAAAELATAILAHAEAVAAATADADVRDVLAAGEALLPVVLAYSDAHSSTRATPSRSVSSTSSRTTRTTTTWIPRRTRPPRA